MCSFENSFVCWWLPSWSLESGPVFSSLLSLEAPTFSNVAFVSSPETIDRKKLPLSAELGADSKLSPIFRFEQPFRSFQTGGWGSPFSLLLRRKSVLFRVCFVPYSAHNWTGMRARMCRVHACLWREIPLRTLTPRAASKVSLKIMLCCSGTDPDDDPQVQVSIAEVRYSVWRLTTDGSKDWSCLFGFQGIKLRLRWECTWNSGGGDN